MDTSAPLQDNDLRNELLDRLDELRSASAGGLEALGGAPTDLLRDDIVRVAESRDDADLPAGLEAIILRFTRPVLYVQQSSYEPGVSGFPESEVVTARLTAAKNYLDAAIPGVGRIDLRNHRLDWVGTGWMITSDVAVTNRHVAESFARESVGGFVFRESSGRRIVRASIDWRHEYGQPEESFAQVEQVLWIEPDGGPDVALLRVRQQDEPNLPDPIGLMTRAEIGAAGGRWVTVIGYPEWDSRNNAEDQQRIFDGVYGVKRLAPGTAISTAPDGTLGHNATTLGGNSGSVVLDLESGKAMGLHFGGIEGDRNSAVQAPILADLLAQHS